MDNEHNDFVTLCDDRDTKPWETFQRGEIEQIIKCNIQSAEQKMSEITGHFCTTGYYLRRQQREEQWRETGASSFADYVRDTYGKSRGWATRMIQINERYSQGGDDPRLDDKYKAYTVSQLQEMLYLPDGGENVTPDMTVKEIRALRQPAADPDPREGQPAADTLTPESVNTDVDDVNPDNDDLKREVTRLEWVRMYDEVERWLPEEISPNTIKRAINNMGIYKDGFDMTTRSKGVRINQSKTETWATVAKQLNAIHKAKAKQEEEEAAAAARPGYIDFNAEWQEAAADDQGGQQAPDQELAQESAEDVCDVAKSEGAAAADQDPEEAQDDGQEGSRQQTDDGEGAAAVIARNVRYMAWEVDMYARDARKHYDELAALQDGLLQEGTDKLIPWTSIKKARMTADALEMLAATIRIREAKDEE